MKIEDIATRWLRIPLSPPIADSTHLLNAGLILVEVTAGGVTGSCYMLSFDYAPALLKGFVDQWLKRHLLGAEADNIRGVFERNLQGRHGRRRRPPEMMKTRASSRAMSRDPAERESDGTLVRLERRPENPRTRVLGVPGFRGNIQHSPSFRRSIRIWARMIPENL